MTINSYLGALWIVAAVTLGIWAFASAITIVTDRRERTLTRILLTTAITLTAWVIGDIARFRLKWTVLGVKPSPDAPLVATYRTVWVVVLIWCTVTLYGPRVWAWLRGRGAR